MSKDKVLWNQTSQLSQHFNSKVYSSVFKFAVDNFCCQLDHLCRIVLAKIKVVAKKWILFTILSMDASGSDTTPPDSYGLRVMPV